MPTPPPRQLHITHGDDWPRGISGFRAWTDVKPSPGFAPAWPKLAKAYQLAILGRHHRHLVFTQGTNERRIVSQMRRD